MSFRVISMVRVRPYIECLIIIRGLRVRVWAKVSYRTRGRV